MKVFNSSCSFRTYLLQSLVAGLKLQQGQAQQQVHSIAA